MINTFTYSNATTPLGQSEQAYYLCYYSVISYLLLLSYYLRVEGYYSGALTAPFLRFGVTLALANLVYACIHLPRPVYGGREGGLGFI